MLASLFTLVSITALAASAHHAHEHRSPHALPGRWYHARDHPVSALFKRAVGADGQDYPEVGTPTWAAKYPVGTPDSSQMPKEWAAALKAAEDAGKIPDIVHATSPGAGINPVYPAGSDPLGAEICSATQKCINPGDIWNGPDGTFATSFDDGPLPFSIKLLDFLKSNNERSTHFLIGITMVQNIEPLKATIASGQDLAVHTYTHPYMTTLSNADIVAQLGWTMQIIHDSSGGKVPRYWRPPFGDSDNRVRAIAAEVFGLRTVIWNRDTNDWGIPAGSTTPQAINTSYTQWLTGPKSPGLVVLEHETSDQSVQAFIDAYPAIKANGWKMSSLASLVDNGIGPYQNVVNGKVAAAGILNSGSSTPSNGGKTNSSAPANPAGPGSSGVTVAGGSKTKAATPSSSGKQNEPAPTSGALREQSQRWVVLAATLACIAGTLSFA